MSALDRLKLLGDRADPATRWQAEAEMQAEAERERQAEERERHREHAAMAESEQVQQPRSEIADLRHELATVRAHIAEREQDLISVGDTISGIVDKLPNWVDTAIEARVKRSEAEMCGKMSERFGELLGRLKALDPTLARAKGEFQFANERERDDNAITELPNPLPPRRAIN